MNFKCDICFRTFKTNAGKSIHQRNHDPISREKRKIATKIAQNKPNVKILKSKQKKEMHSNIEFKEKHRKSIILAHARPDVKERHSNACLKTHQNLEIKLKRKIAIKNAYSNKELRKKNSDQQKKIWANIDLLAKHSRLIADKIINRKIKFKSGEFLSVKAGVIHFRSSYEKRAFEILDNDKNVLTYQVEPLRIEYNFENKIKNYIPDLLVTLNNGDKQIIEIKPKTFVCSSENILKQKAALKLCEQKGWSYYCWTEEELGI